MRPTQRGLRRAHKRGFPRRPNPYTKQNFKKAELRLALSALSHSSIEAVGALETLSVWMRATSDKTRRFAELYGAGPFKFSQPPTLNRTESASLITDFEAKYRPLFGRLIEAETEDGEPVLIVDDLSGLQRDMIERQIEGRWSISDPSEQEVPRRDG